MSSTFILHYTQELYQQVRNLLPEGSPDIALTYQVDGVVWTLIPPDETTTVTQFNIEPNSVVRSSYPQDSDETDP